MTENIVITYDNWHSCPNCDGGGFWTTRLFWDCECEEDYIHPNYVLPFALSPTCIKCGAFADEQPDSRVTEVLEAGLAMNTLISLNEAFELGYIKGGIIGPKQVSGEDDALVPHFELEQETYRIHGVATFKDKFDYKQIEWLITDGLGNLAQVTIELSHLGDVCVQAETIILDEEGEEVSRSGVSKQLFEAERLWR